MFQIEWMRTAECLAERQGNLQPDRSQIDGAARVEDDG